MIFCLFFFAKNEMFFVIFSPEIGKKQAQTSKNITQIRKSRGVFCYSSTVATVHFVGIHTYFVRENSQFSYKIALFWLIFSLFLFA